MKRVFLFRHAKTEQVNKDTPADAARALTERGRKDSPRVGRAMREKGYQPDLILCSTSTRTRQTWEFANAELHSMAKVEFVEVLYAAEAREIAQMIRQLPDSVKKPLLVGHNPGFEELTTSLSPDGTAPQHLPTAGIAQLEFHVDRWPDVNPGSGRLAGIYSPKETGE